MKVHLGGRFSADQNPLPFPGRFRLAFFLLTDQKFSPAIAIIAMGVARVFRKLAIQKCIVAGCVVDVIFRNIANHAGFRVTIRVVVMVFRIRTDEIPNITALGMDMAFRKGAQKLIACDIAGILMGMPLGFRNVAEQISLFTEIAAVGVGMQDGGIRLRVSVAGFLVDVA